MKTQIDLQEYASAEYGLQLAERSALVRSAATLNLTIQPAANTADRYVLTAGHMVGAIELENLSVRIQPKIGIPQLLSLACYAVGALRPQERRLFDFEEHDALSDTLAIALAAAAQEAFSRGLLHGYREEDAALPIVRGRIRFDDQLRRRFGLRVPLEVRYDEFTDDILPNRLVKAAVGRLGSMQLRSARARRGLSWVTAILEQVSAAEYRPNAVPEVSFDQLNEHYRRVVGLARLVLRHTAFELSRGQVRASGLLINMNELFQEFLTVALRESLQVSARTLKSSRDLRSVWLDEGNQRQLEPDLSWWDGPSCTFVGDAKYKNLTDTSAPNADLYQLLAYATALDLPGGLLVYAQGEAMPVSYRVRSANKRLDVMALDLSGSLEDVLERVKMVATRIRELRQDANHLSGLIAVPEVANAG